jgi:uncharacterized protein YcgI (DUF1989 family)
MESRLNLAVREHIVVPAREGRGVRVAAGDHVRIVDLEGSQVGDLFAFNADDVGEYHSAHHTWAVVDRLFPLPGQQFQSNLRRPILTLIEDATPGIHDMLIAPCDPARFEQLGVQGWHASCQENLLTVMAGLGFSSVVVPQSINLFMNIPVSADGSIDWLPAPTKAGDSITVRAEMDLYVVLSACPQDIIVINDKAPSPMAIEVLE